MDDLHIIKKVSGVTIAAIPTSNYKPQSALESSSGKLELHFENEFIGYYSIETVFEILKVVDIIDLSEKNALLVFKGLVKTISQGKW